MKKIIIMSMFLTVFCNAEDGFCILNNTDQDFIVSLKFGYNQEVSFNLCAGIQRKVVTNSADINALVWRVKKILDEPEDNCVYISQNFYTALPTIRKDVCEGTFTILPFDKYRGSPYKFLFKSEQCIEDGGIGRAFLEYDADS